LLFNAGAGAFADVEAITAEQFEARGASTRWALSSARAP
jgi:hypothetical protein